ncbi:MAG: response regulator transcription factor [Gemmatimonadaceae bacterium]|nr:response regulator transcription factor [Gemmatimonadaceae bacterium]
MIRILLADDHAVLRTGMRRLLGDVPDFSVSAEVGSGFEAVEAVKSQAIDVALLDVSMPGSGIVPTIEGIRAASPRTRMIVLSTHPVEQYGIRVLRAGASAYVMKQDPWSDVVAAIRKVHAGARYVTAALAEALAADVGTDSLALSNREVQVLLRLAEGMTPTQVAVVLDVSPKSVYTYRTRLLKKLGLTNSAELIRYALEHRLSE